MAMHPLPPQAYTKDTLLTAYTWLQNQSLNIREMATTPDILVSLFLKATRDGDSSLERPSIQNFKNELKNLAGLMGELENPPTHQSSATQAHAQVIAQSLGLTGIVNAAEPFLSESPAPAKTMVASSAAPQSPMSQVTPAPAKILVESTEIQKPLGMPNLDSKSLEMIREVKAQLNLSSDSEALRAIIRLGHLQITRLFR